MTGRFYYLLSSLPSLDANEAPPIRRERVVELAGRHLSGDEGSAFERIRLWSPAGAATEWPAERRWHAFENGLRQALAAARARRLERDLPVSPGASPPPADAIARDAVEAALQETDPLRAERRLFDARWRFLEERDRETFHTRDNLALYLLRRDLLEEWHGRSSERGRNALEDLRRIAATEWPGEEPSPFEPAAT